LRSSGRIGRAAGRAALALALAALATEYRVRPALTPAQNRWRSMPIVPFGDTLIGISFRPLQARALGLEPTRALTSLLSHPFPVIRLGAMWNQIEHLPGAFDCGDLDRTVEAAQRAGKQIILGLGAVKGFGYPEFFVPDHQLGRPLPEGKLIGAQTHPSLLLGATSFITRMAERYRDCDAIIAWQVEHEAVDPLGMEHSWRLGRDFVAAELAALRAVDANRPIIMSGYLPTSLSVRVAQWWRTRGQGDSLAAAQDLADIVGIDYYPRHALLARAGWAVYLDGAGSPWQRGRIERLAQTLSSRNQRLSVTEGQAEPWEGTTVPPLPASGKTMYSCAPEQLIDNYNHCLKSAGAAGATLFAYLFWGAEYWLARAQLGDLSYIEAWRRILGEGSSAAH